MAYVKKEKWNCEATPLCRRDAPFKVYDKDDQLVGHYCQKHSSEKKDQLNGQGR